MRVIKIWLVSMVSLLSINASAQERLQENAIENPVKGLPEEHPALVSQVETLNELVGSGVGWFPVNDLGARADILQYLNDLYVALSRIDEIKKLGVDSDVHLHAKRLLKTMPAPVDTRDAQDTSSSHEVTARSAVAAGAEPENRPASPAPRETVRVVEVFGDCIRLNDNGSVATVRQGREYKGRRFWVKSGRVYAGYSGRKEPGEEIEFMVNSVDPEMLKFLTGVGER